MKSDSSSAQVPPVELTELFQHSAVAAFAIDPAHFIIFWNRACEGLTGVAAAEMIGTCDHWRVFYPRQRPCLADLVISRNYDDLADLYEKYSPSKLVDGGLHAEGWYHSLNGRRRYLSFDAAPVYDRNNKMVAAIETLHDITDQKIFDEQHQEQLVQLQQALRDNPTLRGFLPICSACKKIRDGKGLWVNFEKYIKDRTGAEFTHSLCQECAKRLYPDFYKG